MSVDPTSVVSMIETCLQIYDYVKAVSESADERERFLQEVSTFKEVLVNLQKRLKDQAAPQNQSSMAPLAMLFDPNRPFVCLVQKDLTELEKKLRRGAGERKTGLRAMFPKMVAAGIWPLDKAESDALFVRIERYKSLISLAMQDDVDKLVREILLMVSDNKGILSEVTKAVADLAQVIGIRLRADDRRKVAEWISKVNFAEFHAENSRKWLEGTGSWVLESPAFQEWVNRTSLPPVLWCYGDAGAGKSVIAAMIVEHLRSISPENIVLVIVCRYNQDRDYLCETYKFMCSLLRQLLQLEAASNVPPTLWESYQKNDYPSEHIVRTLLIDTARLIGRPIFIVLDALDECHLGFKLVTAIQSLGNDFNLLITSRNVFPQIKEYPSLHIRAKDRDILALVNSKIPDLPCIQEDKALQSAVHRQVVTKANGMFLLASYTLWELEHDVVSKVDVHRVLESIPVSLHDAYRQIFKRIDDQGEGRKKLAKHTIMWIYIQNALSLRLGISWSILGFLLACGIFMSEPDIQRNHIPSMDDIVNSCRGLLSVAEDQKHPAFIHYSVQEYISRSEPSTIFDSQDPYELAFRTCTIALHHKENHHIHSDGLPKIWVGLAHFLDSCRPNGPAVVQHALVDRQFTQIAGRFVKADSKPGMAFSRAAFFMQMMLGSRPIHTPWVKALFLDGNGSLTALDYAAAFGLPHTLRLAQEELTPDEHQLRRAMAMAVEEAHWDLVNEVWARGDYDVNIFCHWIGSNALCKLFSDSDSEWSEPPEELRRSFLHHPSTSLYCPRHESLIRCTLPHGRWDYPNKTTLENITMILEQLSHDATGRPCQPARFLPYPSPGSPRSHPPGILNVIAVFMQRANIDLDAHITQMVPPEILLALLMLPWHFVGANYSWYRTIKESAEILRPYARRRVDVPDTRAPSNIADAGTLSDHEIPKMAEAKDIRAPAAEPVPTDSNLAHPPSDEVLEDRVSRDTGRAVEAVDTFRIAVALLVVLGAAIVFYLYVAPAASLVVQPLMQ